MLFFCVAFGKLAFSVSLQGVKGLQNQVPPYDQWASEFYEKNDKVKHDTSPRMSQT